MDNIRRCEYTHCNKCLENQRPNKKFCSDNHRKMEGILKKRELEKRKKLVEMLIKAKELAEQPQTIVGLFEKIYGNK
jgi:hypothetical protein